MNTFYNSRRRSARETFAVCPRRYQGEYLQGVTNESDATRRGDVFHTSRSRYIGTLAERKMTADADLADEVWRSVNADSMLPMTEYHDAVRLWQAWTERYELNLQTFYSSERAVFCKPFNCYLRMDEVHVVDADHLRIVDAKTHWRIPPVETIRESVQTGFYATGARHLYPGFQTYELVYDFVRYNQLISVTLSAAELDEWERWVTMSDEAMDMAETTGIFPPHPGEQCGTCHVACDVADHPQAVPLRLLTLEDAKAAAERIAVRDRDNDIDKEALKAWAKEHGPVAVNGIEWAHREMISRKYPAQQVLTILAASAVQFPIWLSASALKPVLSSKAKYSSDLTSSIASLAVESKTTRFSAKKTSGDDQKPEETE